MSKNKEKKRPFYLDLSFWLLIVANLIVMVWALKEKWQLQDLMLVYWYQSAAIGFFWFFKILMLNDFSTEGMEPPSPANTRTKIETAVFFLIHYGFFNFIHLMFLLRKLGVTFNYHFLITAMFFFLSHGFSFFYNRKWITAGKPNIGGLFLFPYARVLPMHIIICAGDVLSARYGGKAPLVAFTLLKMLADVVMHIIENLGFDDSSKLKNEKRKSHGSKS